MRVSTFLTTLVLVFSIQLSASAATIKLVNAGGLSDGQTYVGPYSVEIDGVRLPVMCYDLGRDLGIGQVWQANLLTVDELSSGYFSDRHGFHDRYYIVGWLFNELVKPANQGARIGIQHAAWLQFDPSAPTVGAVPWLTAAYAASQHGFPGIDFSTLRFIESVRGTTQVQGLVVGGFPSAPAETPEVSTGVFVGTGCGLMAVYRLLRFAKSSSKRIGPYIPSTAGSQG